MEECPVLYGDSADHDQSHDRDDVGDGARRRVRGIHIHKGLQVNAIIAHKNIKVVRCNDRLGYPLLPPNAHRDPLSLSLSSARLSAPKPPHQT